MNILIFDGQGGGIGRQLVAAIRAELPKAQITAVGTNATATGAMLKAGAQQVATGENAVVVACRTADYIVGPVGMVVADSLMGEVTPRMALAIAQSRAVRILIPLNLCDNLVVGLRDQPIAELVRETLQRLKG